MVQPPSKDADSRMPQRQYCYLFEAKGIQRYVFDGGLLRDLVGGSDLVAGLSAGPKAVGTGTQNDLIGQVLQALGVSGSSVRFSRRAGGAFCLHAADQATLQRVRGLWRLAVGLHCPGLECADAGPVEGADELDGLRRAYRAGSATRDNSAAGLPPSGNPFTAFNVKTGRLISRLDVYGDDIAPADLLGEAQRVRSEELKGRIDGVAARFLCSSTSMAGAPIAFPRNLAPTEEDALENPAFPFRGADRRIAVIHADLSGLGLIFRGVTERASSAEEVLAAATAIEAIIERAAQSATSEVLMANKATRRASDGVVQDILPARPILLGGDDITIIVRADLALPFAATLLSNIEAESRSAVDRGEVEVPLSACAGIAIIKAGQPFQMASALAESLCRFAKKSAKAVPVPPFPSFLAFHNSQSTLQEDYGEIRDRELTAAGTSLTGNPYLVTSGTGQTKSALWNSLFPLALALDGAAKGRGKLVEAARLLFDDEVAAGKSWARWREILGEEEPGRTALENIDRILSPDPSLGSPESLEVLKSSIGLISDALEIIDLGGVEHVQGLRAEHGGFA